MNTEDLHWFHDHSSEPLDPINPRIQITFDQLVGRPGFEKLKVNSSVYLFTNRLLVGRILWQWYKSTFLHFALQAYFLHQTPFKYLFSKAHIFEMKVHQLRHIIISQN